MDKRRETRLQGELLDTGMSIGKLALLLPLFPSGADVIHVDDDG
jgi:hypothetical protein